MSQPLQWKSCLVIEDGRFRICVPHYGNPYKAYSHRFHSVSIALGIHLTHEMLSPAFHSFLPVFSLSFSATWTLLFSTPPPETSPPTKSVECFWYIAHYYMLILQIYEYGRSFQLLIPSLISVFSVVWPAPVRLAGMACSSDCYGLCLFLWLLCPVSVLLIGVDCVSSSNWCDLCLFFWLPWPVPVLLTAVVCACFSNWYVLFFWLVWLVSKHWKSADGKVGCGRLWNGS